MADTARSNGDTTPPHHHAIVRPESDLDPAMAAEVELEAERWAEIVALTDLLTRDERVAPGYFRDPDWTVKDLIVHLAWWHGEARSQLLKIATRMSDAQDFEVDLRNAEILAAHKGDAWEAVQADATAARAWMLEAWVGLRHPSTTAHLWVRKAGAEHYAEHLDRLRAWTAELIDLRTRQRSDERDP